MNKSVTRFATLVMGGVFLVTVACGGSNVARSADSADTSVSGKTVMPPAKENARALSDQKTPAMQALIEAYPDFIKDIKDNKVIFTDGSTMVYDDGRDKDFVTRLDNSDVEDMFFTAYRSGVQPEYLSDAGRSRCEALFKKMYGGSSAQVQRKLVNVSWFGKNIKFTSVNGAAEQLKKVAAEIARKPELKKYVDCSGTFYWRQVRGAKRLSAHSYGIAIDIGVKNSDYWLWKNPKAGETARIKYVNRMPRELVEIFERHGFVWGGGWYHYDTMHFEYRPEIIGYGRRAKK